MRPPRLLLAASGLLGACTVGPDYFRPAAPVTPAYKETQGWVPGHPSDTIDRGAWWSVYHDPELDGLERLVAIDNQTLKQAEAAYRTATALVREARAGLFPTLGVNGSDNRNGNGSHGGSFVSSGGTTTVSGLGSGSGSGSGSGASYAFQGTANWDLDVWGRIRRTVESDVAGAQASAADIANAQLSAQGQVAIDYFDMRAADELAHLLADTVADYQRSLTIAQNQYAAGTAAKSDVITAQAQLLSAQAQLVNAGVQRATFEHAIAVLTGRPPAAMSLPVERLASLVPVAPTGVPSVLLQRRPDIAAAERVMQQQNALIGVAVAAYYPDITLSALGGWSSGSLNGLLSATNTLWSLGAAFTETVFDGGLRSGQVAAARATYDQSVAAYRQTVLTAFQEIEDQLSTLRILEQQAAVEDAAVKAAQQAVAITLNEYAAGTIVYSTVITAQTLLLSDQQAALAVQQNRLVASVSLIQDLGGGWNADLLPPARGLVLQGPVFP